MKEIQILNNGDALYDIRRKINENFELVHEKATTEPLVSFGVNEGNETDGVADLLDIDGDTLNFKVGGEYPNLVITSGDGVTTKIESVNPLHLQNLADGEYKVVVDGSNSNITNAEFYSQLLEPENPNDGDVWFNGESSVKLQMGNYTAELLMHSSVNFNCVASTGQLCVAAGEKQIILVSTDGGKGWSPITLSTNNANIKIVGCEAYNDKIYLVANDTSSFYIDQSGVVWNGPRVSQTALTVTKFKKVHETFMAFTTQGTVAYSKDMSTFTQRDMTYPVQTQDIIYKDGVYYSVDINGAIRTSTDYMTWELFGSVSQNIQCLCIYDNNILCGNLNGLINKVDISTKDVSSIQLESVGTTKKITPLEDGNFLLVGTQNLCLITNDFINFTQIVVTDTNLLDFNDGFIVGTNGRIYGLVQQKEWVPYPYIPIGEVVIENGEVTYFTTYAYNTNGLFEATTSTFGLLRTAAEPDELNCHCQEAVLTPANLYNLNNYRTMNTSYEVDQKVGCPYHHNLQLNCIQAGTTSNEGLNTKGLLEPGTTIEDGTVIWEVEELGTGGGGLEIGDIGIAPLGIDETKGKRRYLNGQLIIQEQYVQFTDKVKSAVALYPSLACTESEWQTTATMTVGGQVGKFVVDNDAGTIRLPKIIMPIQGLTDLSKLAEIVEAGLPNIKGEINSRGNSSGFGSIYYATNGEKAGAFSATKNASGHTSGAISLSGNIESDVVDFDASRSNPIYGNSDTVQQEQIQYPYFIQVATGAETEDNIINEIELNNPFSLLDYKYSEYELNNISWLRSEGQYNSKAIYPAVYDLLLKIYNGTETKAGVSVKLTTEEFTDYDFVLNTAEETFRLPIKVKQKFYNAVSGNFPVVGNGMTLGLTDGTVQGGIRAYVQDNKPLIGGSTNIYGQPVGTKSSSGGFTNELALGVTTNSSKSGLVAKLSSTEVTGLYLYFYVGETVQNANLINAGRIEEKLHSLISDNSSLLSGLAFPSNKYIDLTLGATGSSYTAPANGWIFLRKVTSGADQYAELINNNNSMGTITTRPGSGSTCSVYIPCKKGEKVLVYYSAGGETKYFRFVYAEGEV